MGFGRIDDFPAVCRQCVQDTHFKIDSTVPESSIREGATIADSVLVYKTVVKLAPLMTALEAARGSGCAET